MRYEESGGGRGMPDLWRDAQGACGDEGAVPAPLRGSKGPNEGPSGVGPLVAFARAMIFFASGAVMVWAFVRLLDGGRP